MEVTLNIPDHISSEDAQAVIAAFMAAQNAAQAQEPVSQDDADPDDDTQQDDTQDTDADTDDPFLAPAATEYTHVDGAGSVPMVSMSVGTHEGGIYGSMSVIRMAESAEKMRSQLDEYKRVAEDAANDPDRKRPPRAEPALVDGAVKFVMQDMHLKVMQHIMDESPDSDFNMSGWSGDIFQRRERSNLEQEYIGFTISAVTRRVPYALAANGAGNAWGVQELIHSEFGVFFTKAQVRASLARLQDSDFITHTGTCGKSARYRLVDRSEWMFTTNDTDNDDA